MKAQYNQLWQMRTKILPDTLQVKSGSRLGKDETMQLIRGGSKPSKPVRLTKEAAERIIRGQEKPANSVSFKYHLGFEPRDLMPAGQFWQFLLRERIFKELSEKAFSGWGSYAVQIRGKNQEAVNGYRGLVVRGKAGGMDGVRGKPLPTSRGELPAKMGLLFMNDEWDGSDIFFCSYRLCVTERVREALQAIKVDNIAFQRLDKIKTYFNLPRSS